MNSFTSTISSLLGADILKLQATVFVFNVQSILTVPSCTINCTLWPWKAVLCRWKRFQQIQKSSCCFTLNLREIMTLLAIIHTHPSLTPEFSLYSSHMIIDRISMMLTAALHKCRPSFVSWVVLQRSAVVTVTPMSISAKGKGIW